MPFPSAYEKFLSFIRLFSFDLGWLLSAACLTTAIDYCITRTVLLRFALEYDVKRPCLYVSLMLRNVENYLPFKSLRVCVIFDMLRRITEIFPYYNSPYLDVSDNRFVILSYPHHDSVLSVRRACNWWLIL